MKNINFKSAIFLYSTNPFAYHVNQFIYHLARRYPLLLCIEQIGKSPQGTPLLMVKLGCGPTTILIQATHHAREAITTILLLDQLQYLLKLFKKHGTIKDICICQLLKQVTFIFVPLVNPDGANLVLNGKGSISKAYQDKLYLQVSSFSNWKANIRGVDLNENYPTKFPSNALTSIPGAQGYPGPYSFSEPETLALKALTERYCFDGTLSYHSSGEDIYWYYHQTGEQRDLAIARIIAQETGYNLISKTDSVLGSGFKDWFIETYQKPGLTLEVSPYIGPQKVPAINYPLIFKQNKMFLFYLGNLFIV